jgi:N-acetylglutamate synthase-like GNAT family acetyltransferase
MYLNIIQKCATRHLFDIQLMKKTDFIPLQIGACKLVVDNNSAILNNLEIHDPYKKNGYGSLFIQEIEKSFQLSHNIKEIGLTAWQSDKNNVVDFFKKNGYQQTNTTIEQYDDSVTQFDLYNMTKKIT